MADTPTDVDLLDVVRPIVEADDPRVGLHEVHVRLQRVVGSDLMGISLLRPDGLYDWTSTEWPEDFFAGYPYHAAHDFVRDAVLRAPGEVLRDEEMLDRAAIERNAFYHFARDLGTPLEQVMAVCIPGPDNWHAGMTFYRMRRRPFTLHEQRVVTRLVPHFRCALERHRRRQRDALQQTLLRRAMIGLARLDPSGVVIERTDAFEALIERHTTSDERDRSGIPHRVTAAWSRLTTHLADDRAHVFSFDPIEDRTRGLREAVALEVQLCRDGRTRDRWLLTAREIRVRRDWLDRLSWPQRRVALHLILGRSQDVIAQELGYKPSTVERYAYYIRVVCGVETRYQLMASNAAHW